MNHFHGAKVGGFLHACKFFFEFLMGMWRHTRDNATERMKGFRICRAVRIFITNLGIEDL